MHRSVSTYKVGLTDIKHYIKKKLDAYYNINSVKAASVFTPAHSQFTFDLKCIPLCTICNLLVHA